MNTLQNISLFLALAFLAIYAVHGQTVHRDDDFEGKLPKSIFTKNLKFYISSTEDRMVDDDERMNELNDQERDAVDRFTEFMNALQRCGGSYYGGYNSGYNNYPYQPYYPPPPTTTQAPLNTTTAAYNPYLRPSGYRCYG